MVFGRNCQEQRHIFMKFVFSDKDLVCGCLALKKAYILRGPLFYKIAPIARAHECLFFGATHAKRYSHRPSTRAPQARAKKILAILKMFTRKIRWKVLPPRIQFPPTRRKFHVEKLLTPLEQILRGEFHPSFQIPVLEGDSPPPRADLCPLLGGGNSS